MSDRIVSMHNIVLAILMVFLSSQATAFSQGNQIMIPNRGVGIGTSTTNIAAGPDVGSILNAHFFPGIQDYLMGNYGYAMAQMDYFLARPQFSQMNPNQNQYFSIGHYLRGMIYLYHAEGIGRHERAKQEFEAAIRRNSKNCFAYLELAHVYSFLGLKPAAVELLTEFLQTNPTSPAADQARKDLTSLQTAKNE